MAWGRLDDGFGDHPKVLDLIDTLEEMAGAAAIGLWTLALAYANKTKGTAKTPGFIPRSFARSRARVPASLGDRLVDVGLWEQAEGGWIIHDFADYLPSPDLKSKRAEAGRKGAEARWGKSASQEPQEDEPAGRDSNLPSDATMANSKPCPVPVPTPIPKEKKTASSSSARGRARGAGGTRIPDDFALTPEMIAWGTKNAPHLADTALHLTDEFVDYWRGRPGAAGEKADWVATWRNWMRRKETEAKAILEGRHAVTVGAAAGGQGRSTADIRAQQALDAGRAVQAELEAGMLL